MENLFVSLGLIGENLGMEVAELRESIDNFDKDL